MPLAALILASATLTGMMGARVMAARAWAEAFDLALVTRMPATTFLYDRHGREMTRWFEENRIPLTEEEIPELLRQAVVATEDKRFYQHGGFDALATARALWQNVRGARIASGASTITQQLARNSANMFDQSLDRKLKELFLAFRLEANFSKKEILTHYLNRIYFGQRNHGVAAAAADYFGKRPMELSLSEVALLAGVISAPNTFSPWHNVDLALKSRARALRRMKEAGFISPEEEAAANAEPLVLRPRMDLTGDYAVAAIRDELVSKLGRDLLMTGGLRIYTTIDLGFQRSAEQAVELALLGIESDPDYAHLTREVFLTQKHDSDDAPAYLQAAVAAISNETGAVLALVGGRSFQESPFNRAIHARRQAGSTLKPFVMANAFNVLNASAFTQVNAAPFDLTKASLQNAFAPAGSLDAEGKPVPEPRWISLRTAVENSDNYAAMRVALLSGLDSFAFLTGKALDQPFEAFPSSALGAVEVTPLQLASAFTAFPRQGVVVRPYLIHSVLDPKGRVLFQHQIEEVPLLSPQIAFQIHDLMTGVVTRGTARRLATDYPGTGPVAGKTGTSNAVRDAWFVGYSRPVTMAVWVGFDRPTTIRPRAGGGSLAAPLWGDIMQRAAPYYPPAEFKAPPEMVRVRRNDLGDSEASASHALGWLRQDQLDGYLERLDLSVLETR